MLNILERITNGDGQEGDIELLERLAYMIKQNSLCGLGQTAPNPVISTLKYFRHEYEAHIHDQKCPAGACKALKSAYQIDAEDCIGCTACVTVCPVDAIDGERKEPHTIAEDTCIACGACEPKCPVDAISQG